MIQGVVNVRHEAVVRLRVRGPGGAESDMDVIVDSGFTASLTLPMTMNGCQSFSRVCEKDGSREKEYRPWCLSTSC